MAATCSRVDSFYAIFIAMLSIALLVRKARVHAGLSQRELAARADMPQSSVGRIEAELVSPSFATLARVLDAAGFELVADIRPKPVTDAAVEAYKQDIDRTLLRENLKKTPEERVLSLQAVVRLADEARRAGRTLRGGE